MSNLRRGLVARSDIRHSAQEGHTHLQVDHLQPHSWRHGGKTVRAYATWIEVQKPCKAAASDQGEQYRQPDKRPRASRISRQQTFRELKDGHHHGRIRTCHTHPDGTFYQFHPHGKVQTGTESSADGESGGLIVVSIQSTCKHHHHWQRNWVCGTSCYHEGADMQRKRKNHRLLYRFILGSQKGSIENATNSSENTSLLKRPTSMTLRMYT